MRDSLRLPRNAQLRRSFQVEEDGQALADHVDARLVKQRLAEIRDGDQVAVLFPPCEVLASFLQILDMNVYFPMNFP